MEFRAALTGPSMAVGFSQLQGNLAAYIPVILLGTVAYTALDLAPFATGSSKQLPIFLYSLVGMFLSMVSVRTAWRALSGQAAVNSLPIGGYFIAGSISGIATLIGFVLLILPGCYLLGRWSLFLVILQGEGASGIDSLKRSWLLTERDWLAGTFILIISAVAGLAGAAIGVMVEGQGTTTVISAVVVGNGIAVAASVWGSIATVALYRDVTGSVDQIDQIFG